ncbi:MAG: hypothetical protein P4L86_09595 [Mycobacterium sp.]|nr:hypothetical protein [Mycobacterium sp.]
MLLSTGVDFDDESDDEAVVLLLQPDTAKLAATVAPTIAVITLPDLTGTPSLSDRRTPAL